MNSLVKFSIAAAIAAAPALADENFGGIGVTIYQVPAGVYVAEVIPGGPASETKLKTGDVIVAVDGVSLKGQNIEFSKEQIRGQIDKPVELTYVSEGDTLSAVVRRASMLVKDFNAEDVSAWYGDKQEFNAAELETFASGSETDKQLLAVLSRGTVVASDAEKVSARNLNGVFVKKAEVVAPKVNSNKGVKSNGAVLKGFSRLWFLRIFHSSPYQTPTPANFLPSQLLSSTRSMPMQDSKKETAAERLYWSFPRPWR
jgi:S1-C subfamily serine protease